MTTVAEAIATLRAAGAFGRGIPLVPGTNVALLTKPSKMPGYSYSLPAGNPKHGEKEGMCPGAVFGPNSICGGCYANPDSVKLSKHGVPMRRGGSYEYPDVRRAQSLRRAWTLDCLMTKEGRDEWVTVMTAAITWATRTVAVAQHQAAVCSGAPMDYAMIPRARGKSRRIPWFRWHDSGDVFSPAYGQMIEAVCAALPDVRFWLPTRSWHRTPRILTVLQTVNALPNVAVRPSALFLQDDAPRVAGLSAGTGAKSDGYTCPSSRQNGECRSCRACWRKSGDVYYKVH